MDSAGLAMNTTPEGRLLHRVLAAACLLAAALGCGPNTLDLSSVEDLQESLVKLREPMAPEELDRFDEALGFLVGDVALGAAFSPEEAEAVLERFRPLAGRTGEGIVAEARFRRIREVRSAVIWLESWRDESEEARRELADFRFIVARVFKRHKDFLDWPVFEIKVDNGTEHTISLVHFRAALLKPGEVNPWLLEEFDHVVFGGLAPGDRGTWRIEPKQREWIRLIDPHPELKFGLEAMRLEALGGRTLVATDWGDVESHRLSLYRRTLRRIRTSGRLALDSPPVPTVPGPLMPAAPSAGAEGEGVSGTS
jgi:hypothetical protein